MSDFDAYEDEMERLLTDRAADRLFAGNAPEELRDLDDFLRDVRSAFEGRCRESVSSRHAAAMAAATRDSTPTVAAAHGRGIKRRTGMHRIAWLGAKVVAAALAAMAVTAGAAFAGIDLPDQVEDVFDRLGIDLPDNAQMPEDLPDLPEDARADEVRAVIDALEPSEMGCRFGMAVAAGASEGQSAAAGDPCSKGEEGRAGGVSKSARGRDRAQEASSTAPRSSGKGLQRADEASEGRSNAGTSTADEASGGRSSKGPSAADEASESMPGGGATESGP